MFDQEKIVYVVWVNTDRTEGRGKQIPTHVCESLTTAKRLGKGQDVQGMDAKVTEEQAMRIGHKWYAPVDIKQPTKPDVLDDEANQRINAALEKARAAGLTDEDLAVLRELGERK